MSEEKLHEESGKEYDYMEELSKAYAAAFANRLERHPDLPEEQRDLLAKMQHEIYRLGESISNTTSRAENKELALLLRESAKECMRLFHADERTTQPMPLPSHLWLPRAVLLANRSLNLLRHLEGNSHAITLILSELSALYALAAIG